MDTDKLFVRTIDDLKQKLISEDAYEYLKASALLRSLILDGGNSLIHSVNRPEARRLDIRFKFGTLDSQLRMFKQMNISVSELHILDGFSPKFQICMTSAKEGGLDDLLKAVLIVSSGIEYSVKDTIKYLANIEGGVHRGVAKTEIEKNLESMCSRVDQATVIERTVKGVSQVVVDGTVPLYNLLTS